MVATPAPGKAGATDTQYWDPATRETAGGPARARDAAPPLIGDPPESEEVGTNRPPAGVPADSPPPPPMDEDAPPPRRRAQKAPAGVAGPPDGFMGGEAAAGAGSQAAHTLAPVPAAAKQGLAGAAAAAHGRGAAGSVLSQAAGWVAQMSCVKKWVVRGRGCGREGKKRSVSWIRRERGEKKGERGCRRARLFVF